MEIFSLRSGGTAIVDYAHTPDAYEKLFFRLNNLAEEQIKIFVVFGCGGDRDTGKRKEMAAIAEKYSTFSFVTMDNPRTESFEKINVDIIQGFSGSNYEIISDRKTAVVTALKRIRITTIRIIWLILIKISVLILRILTIKVKILKIRP